MYLNYNLYFLGSLSFSSANNEFIVLALVNRVGEI